MDSVAIGKVDEWWARHMNGFCAKTIRGNRQDHERDACLRVNCAISEAIELTALSVDRH